MELFMVECEVSAWERAIAWYREVLGLRVRLRDDGGRFAMLEAEGGGRIALKGTRGTAEGPAQARLVFRVERLDEQAHALAGRGVAFEGPEVNRAERYRAIRLEGPEGTPITLFEWAEGGGPITR